MPTSYVERDMFTLNTRATARCRAKSSHLIVDNFAGGGGASMGMERATGRAVDIAINHDENALLTHEFNHPATKHYCDSVWSVCPEKITEGKGVRLAWFSPDCRHFSRAKGKTPVSNKIRCLAWIVVRWIRKKRPSMIIVENVAEFQEWGPTIKDEMGHTYPDPNRKGESFRRWVNEIKRHGYNVEWKVLNAADYGAPTHRRRLFVVCKLNGKVRWPEPTHGPACEKAYRTIGECIDWSIPCPSIFERKKPLADKTLARIAKGVVKYVLHNENPFVVRIGQTGGSGSYTYSTNSPLTTIVSKAEHCLVAATIIKHYTGVVGHTLNRPLGTITQIDHHSLATANLFPVAATTGPKPNDVYAFLCKYYGTGGQWQGCDEPIHTIVTKQRYALVTTTIGGSQFVVADIGCRMLQPHELAKAQGFPDDYVLVGSKANQVAKIGNSVPPQLAEALVRANW